MYAHVCYIWNHWYQPLKGAWYIVWHISLDLYGCYIPNITQMDKILHGHTETSDWLIWQSGQLSIWNWAVVPWSSLSVYSNFGYINNGRNFVCGMYISILPHKWTLNDLGYAIFVTFKEHSCCCQIFCSSMINTCYSVSIFDSCTVLWGVYVDYSMSAVGHIYAVWQAYLFRGICQKCEMYVCKYIFIWGIYTNIAILYVHMK